MEGGMEKVVPYVMAGYLGIESTVPFRLIRPSRVTGPVVLAEFSHLSRVTTPVADDSR